MKNIIGLLFLFALTFVVQSFTPDTTNYDTIVQCTDSVKADTVSVVTNAVTNTGKFAVINRSTWVSFVCSIMLILIRYLVGFKSIADTLFKSGINIFQRLGSKSSAFMNRLHSISVSISVLILPIIQTTNGDLHTLLVTVNTLMLSIAGVTLITTTNPELH